MQDITWTIAVGVITGLLTASLLLIIKSLFLNSFLPWYRQTMYRGVDLNGSWYSCSGSQKVLLEIEQNCERVSGKATAQLMRDTIPDEHIDSYHLDDIRTFDIEGEVSERFVSLRLKHTDKKRLGIVTFLLQVEGDGTKLMGQGCWYTPNASLIASGERIFYRSEERAENKYRIKNNSKDEELELEFEES